MTRVVTLRSALLVFAGGVIGTAARVGLMAVTTADAGVMTVNIVGAFALGVLTGFFAAREHRHKREAQLLVGTGLLGSFTTYSALAVQATALPGLWWALATVIVGALAAGAGLWAGALLGRRGGRGDVAVDGAAS